MPPVIDSEALRQFDDLNVEGEPDILVELIDSYLRTSPPKFDLIAQSVKAKNYSELKLQAHSLKSSSMTLGAKEVGQLCQQMESHQGNPSAPPVDELFAKFEAAFHQACAELKEIRDKRAAQTP
jgi:HPt (histidine-containing phosphotransfer) domain-containing protein